MDVYFIGVLVVFVLLLVVTLFEAVNPNCEGFEFWMIVPFSALILVFSFLWPASIPGIVIAALDDGLIELEWNYE